MTDESTDMFASINVGTQETVRVTARLSPTEYEQSSNFVIIECILGEVVVARAHNLCSNHDCGVYGSSESSFSGYLLRIV